MVEVAADDDVVVGPHLDDVRQIILPCNGRYVYLLEVSARLFLEPVALAEKVIDRSRSRRFAEGVMIKRSHQPRHPADAAFEHRDAQRREAVEDAAHDQTCRADHVSEGKPQRGGEHFEAVVALAAD